MSNRRKQAGELTCKCKAYSFPHRMTGGKCRAITVVSKHYREYEGNHPLCIHCISRNTEGGAYECPALSGTENTGACEAWQEFAVREEIRISNKKCKF